jgi:hypothetical protein
MNDLTKLAINYATLSLSGFAIPETAYGFTQC